MYPRLKFMFFLILLLAGCATADLPAGSGRQRNESSWPLFISSGDAAAVSTETRSVQWFFTCQTELVPTPEERGKTALWKVNFINFTKARADLFDGDTAEVRGAAGLIYDKVGGWFLVVPVVDRISGDCGITADGVIFVRRDLFGAKLGDGLVRCKYKHPNPSGDLHSDTLYHSDMTLVGIPVPASATRSATHGTGSPK